jgi:phage terminase large subunit
MLAARGLMEQMRILCARELQNSLKDSSMSEIIDAIESEPWLAQHYEYGESYIRGKNGTEFIFRGLRHNSREIKSMAKIKLCWVEEAEAVSNQSWQTLIPTIRKPGSEIWLTWNPESQDSATNKRFILDPPENSKIIKLNWMDNPWFPEVLEQERQADLRRDPDYYAHVWEGECITRTDAQIFAGKWRVDEFEPGKDWDGPYFGLDFGFAQDPTAAIKCWTHNDCLYIEAEAGRAKMELDETAAEIAATIPDIAAHTIRADNARPESISYLKRHGLQNIVSVKKWPGSVEDGVQFIKSFREIILHPRCTSTAQEFRLYSYKVDRNSGDIIPTIMDAYNHYIDALRYALAPMIQNKGQPSIRTL